MTNKFLLLVIVLSMAIVSCSRITEYRITLNNGEVVSVPASEYDCGARVDSVGCYKKGNGKPLPMDLVYYDVSKFEVIR